MTERKNDNAAGAKAEDLAADFLVRQGLTIVERNFRVRGGSGGEIDLIARQGRTLVFVEVRLRRHGGFGSAADSIGRAKRQRLIRAAQYWLLRHGPQSCRFDCVLLSDLSAENIEWLVDAFQTG
ncbi:MAG: YraN family protein [Zoogloeaceae bacterium]|nr:YraN family protein [Zoogloeaceae bacterium]